MQHHPGKVLTKGVYDGEGEDFGDISLGVVRKKEVVVW